MEKIKEEKQFAMLGLSLTIVRNKKGQYLCINEVRDRGWWIPGGRVDPPEDFFTAAKRECKEEAGIDVDLKGVLRIQESPCGKGYMRMKVIFYAEPIDENQPLKSEPDSESLEARWTSVQEFINLVTSEGNKMRGRELIQYGNYIDQGGQIFPLSVLEQMDSKVDLNNKLLYNINENTKKEDSEQMKLRQENEKLIQQIQEIIQSSK